MLTHTTQHAGIPRREAASEDHSAARLDAVGLAGEARSQLHERGERVLAPLGRAQLAAGQHALQRRHHIPLARLQRRLALQQRSARRHQLAVLAWQSP